MTRLNEYAQTDHQKFVQHFDLEYCRPSTIVDASLYPTLDNLDHLTNSGYKTTDFFVANAIYEVIYEHRLDVIKYLEKHYMSDPKSFYCNYCFMGIAIMGIAIRKNNSNMVNHLYRHECPWRCERWGMFGIDSANKEALKTAYNLGCPMEQKYIEMMNAL